MKVRLASEAQKAKELCFMSSFLMSFIIIIDKARERGERVCRVLAAVDRQRSRSHIDRSGRRSCPIEQQPPSCFTLPQYPGAVKTKTFGRVRAEAV